MNNTHLLNRQLANLWTLMHAEYHCHFSAKGPTFMQAHELFESFYDDTQEHIDTLGEEIRRLGTVPVTRLDEIQELTHDDIAGTIRHASAVEDCISLLYTVKGYLSQHLDEAIVAYKDHPATEDILIEIKRGQELHRYFLQQTST